jgi:Protein of unknown function (DUF732)
MFARQVTKLAGPALVAGTLGLAAVATSGTAAALRSADDTFVKAITAEGIGYDSSRTAINGAHHVCAALDAGASPADLTNLIPGGADLTKRQVGVILASAVDNYCPEYDALFQ